MHERFDSFALMGYYSVMLTTDAEAAILQRVIRPEAGDLSPDAARALLALGFQESDHSVIADLSAKARAGVLTGAEQDELDSYINVSHFMAFVHSKARMSLKKPGHSAA